MKAYHITGSEEAYRSIVKDGVLHPGHNVADDRGLVHLTLKRPGPGDELANYFVRDAGLSDERWILELDLPDGVVLEDDPATEEGHEGAWKVFAGDMPVRIRSVEHVRDLKKWNRNEFGPYPERDAEDEKFTSKEWNRLFPGTPPKFR